MEIGSLHIQAIVVCVCVCVSAQSQFKCALTAHKILLQPNSSSCNVKINASESQLINYVGKIKWCSFHNYCHFASLGLEECILFTIVDESVR